MDGSKVWQAFADGKIVEIRDYCETDALNTYLMYLRFELMRGALDSDEYANEIKLVRQFLQDNADKQHWQEFLAAWSK